MSAKLIYSFHQYDVLVFSRLNNSAIRGMLVRSCKLISKSGDGLLYIALGAWLYMENGFADPLLRALLLAFSIERPLYFLLKNGFKRNRPQQALAGFCSVIRPSDQFSFPSGHTSAAFMVATLVCHFLPGLSLVMYPWALLVGFSRVVLGVHFPTDTLVGLMLGASVAIFCLNYIL